MVNGPWQLLYKDSNNDNTVLAVLQGEVPSGAYTLRQARWKTRNRGIDKLSLIAEKDLFKNVPQDTSSFGTSEPGIFWQGYRSKETIQSVDTSNDQFVVSGDFTSDFEEGGAVKVVDSTRGDDDTFYKVSDPSDVTYDSNNDETTITVVEDVTDSTVDGSLELWENIFRGYANTQGQITEQGNVKLTLYGFIKYIGKESVNISSSSDIDDVMSKLTPSGYTYDSPSSSSVDYIDQNGNTTSGYAPVDNYSLTDVDRAVGFRETLRNYGYILKAKANKELRFEPVGFGSSIDTIDSRAEGDTNNTQGTWKEWTAGDRQLANLVNTVRVVNSKTGTKYDSGIITDSTSVQQFGNLTPKGGNPVKKGYVDSDQEATRVAQNIIRSSQNPSEGGRVKVPGRYTNNVSNSTFTLNDSVRSLESETFVAWSQVNFYPENKTILEFEFENQSEKETDITDDIRAERSTTFADSTKDVGQQSYSGDTGSAPSDTGTTGSVNDNQSDTAVTGSVGLAGTTGNGVFLGPYQDTNSNLTFDGNWHEANNTISIGTNNYLFHGWFVTWGVVVDWTGGVGNTGSIVVRAKDKDTGNYYPDSNGIVAEPDPNRSTTNDLGYQTICPSPTIFIPRDLSGDTLALEYKATGYFTNKTQNANLNYSYFEDVGHDHPDSFDTDDNDHSHGDNIDTSDNDHGGTGDATGQHGSSGTTDSKNVDIASEDKTDR